MCFDSRTYFKDIKRFGYIVYGTDFKSLTLVLDLIKSGQKDYRYIAGGVVLLKNSAYLISAHKWHDNVQKDKIWFDIRYKF